MHISTNDQESTRRPEHQYDNIKLVEAFAKKFNGIQNEMNRLKTHMMALIQASATEDAPDAIKLFEHLDNLHKIIWHCNNTFEGMDDE